MARDHARINLAIWQDDDWRALPPLAQHLYFTLWTHPGLSYAGVVDWRPGRIAAMAQGWKVDDVMLAADCLQARLFIVTDDIAEEALVRSFVRFDGLMKQPHMAVSFANAAAAVASATIRGVITHEAQKMQRLDPELAGWAKPQVAQLLAKTAIDPRDLTLPDDPFRDGFTPTVTPLLTPSVTPTITPLATEPDPSAHPPVQPPAQTPSTPSPSPTPSLHAVPAETAAPKAPRRKPERPLPDDWQPTSKHHELATAKGVDIDNQAMRFRNHAATHDRRARDWDAAFRNWLDGAIAGPTTRPEPVSSWDRQYARGPQ